MCMGCRRMKPADIEEAFYLYTFLFIFVAFVLSALYVFHVAFS